MRAYALAACLALGLLSEPIVFSRDALAGAGFVDEVKLGILAADTGIGGPKVEDGIAISGELLFKAPQWLVSPGDPGWKRFLLAPRPTIGFTVNTYAGTTSFGYAALNWSADLAQQVLNDHDGIYASFEFGGAVNNSDLNPYEPNNKDMGSRALFRLAVELGYNVDEHVNLSLYYEHFSNANLGTVNPGMNNLGVRLGYRF
jgi:lipid A 3-O-deacylase